MGYDPVVPVLRGHRAMGFLRTASAARGRGYLGDRHRVVQSYVAFGNTHVKAEAIEAKGPRRAMAWIHTWLGLLAGQR